jgi:hypothetical protein
MSEFNENKALDNIELNEVSGGSADYRPEPKFRVGQKVRAYCYFVGRIKEINEDSRTGTWKYDISDGFTRQQGVKESDIDYYYG